MGLSSLDPENQYLQFLDSFMDLAKYPDSTQMEKYRRDRLALMIPNDASSGQRVRIEKLQQWARDLSTLVAVYCPPNALLTQDAQAAIHRALSCAASAILLGEMPSKQEIPPPDEVRATGEAE